MSAQILTDANGDVWMRPRMMLLWLAELEPGPGAVPEFADAIIVWQRRIGALRNTDALIGRTRSLLELTTSLVSDADIRAFQNGSPRNSIKITDICALLRGDWR